mmetsp:Transcript_13544/g.28970  ORF Transcript_13544/g.28970 Transcript_13544/m.28970 type:complete len:455 (+) Transcript_13544:905-2269(+)
MPEREVLLGLCLLTQPPLRLAAVLEVKDVHVGRKAVLCESGAAIPHGRVSGMHDVAVVPDVCACTQGELPTLHVGGQLPESPSGSRQDPQHLLKSDFQEGHVIVDHVVRDLRAVIGNDLLLLLPQPLLQLGLQTQEGKGADDAKASGVPRCHSGVQHTQHRVIGVQVLAHSCGNQLHMEHRGYVTGLSVIVCGTLHLYCLVALCICPPGCCVLRLHGFLHITRGAYRLATAGLYWTTRGCQGLDVLHHSPGFRFEGLLHLPLGFHGGMQPGTRHVDGDCVQAVAEGEHALLEPLHVGVGQGAAQPHQLHAPLHGQVLGLMPCSNAPCTAPAGDEGLGPLQRSVKLGTESPGAQLLQEELAICAVHVVVHHVVHILHQRIKGREGDAEDTALEPLEQRAQRCHVRYHHHGHIEQLEPEDWAVPEVPGEEEANGILKDERSIPNQRQVKNRPRDTG